METNPVGWFEIYVQDICRATKFYETVLGIKLNKLEAPVPGMEMMAFPLDMERPGASGALTKMDGFESGSGGTIVYFGCEDCAVEASRVEAAGGKIKSPKMSIEEFGAFALAIDTEGNMFGLHSMQ
ncbi:VOC family protein [Rosistilla oblonga]|uniref:VOC family protein n=1 Tax=Rosistilla oblonga TaxID=2527990 RepID=UPI003A97E369